jgi:hypothetical protein
MIVFARSPAIAAGQICENSSMTRSLIVTTTFTNDVSSYPSDSKSNDA